jgi:hypothetical protein
LNNPEVAERLRRLTAAENPENPQAFQESLFNRAAARGTSLDQEMRSSYYPAVSRAGKDPGKNRGAFDEATKAVVGGSNLTGYATGNASGRVGFGYGRGAGDPYTYMTTNRERYGIENNPRDRAWADRMRREGTAGSGGAGDGGAGGAGSTTAGKNPDGSEFPEAKKAPGGGDPEAFIAHHTSGRGTPEGVVADWRRGGRGIGTQYIMDRQGVIHDISKEYGYGGRSHIKPGWGRLGSGLSNRNTVGMEIIARNDRDVTPEQAKAYADFMATRYPGTRILGHGEVNPGHREADEGITAKRAAEERRRLGGGAGGPGGGSGVTGWPRMLDVPGRPGGGSPGGGRGGGSPGGGGGVTGWPRMLDVPGRGRPGGGGAGGYPGGGSPGGGPGGGYFGGGRGGSGAGTGAGISSAGEAGTGAGFDKDGFVDYGFGRRSERTVIPAASFFPESTIKRGPPAGGSGTPADAAGGTPMRSIGSVGGRFARPPALSIGSSGSLSDTPGGASGSLSDTPRRASLDRGALDGGSEVVHTGKGSLYVKVDAPAGTSVNAKGEGLFKTTQIDRQTQMERGESSPREAKSASV